MEHSEIFKTQVFDNIVIPDANSYSLEGNVRLNFQSWANAYLRDYQSDDIDQEYKKEYIDLVYGEVLTLMRKHIYIVNISSFWVGLGYFYTITLYDKYISGMDDPNRVPRLNKLAQDSLDFMRYISDGDYNDPHLTNISHNMIQLTFYIC